MNHQQLYAMLLRQSGQKPQMGGVIDPQNPQQLAGLLGAGEKFRPPPIGYPTPTTGTRG